MFDSDQQDGVASHNYMPNRRLIAAMMILCVVVGDVWGMGASLVYPQSSTATLSGTVMDERNARIPAVQLTLLNLSTALQRHAVTDEQGFYVVPLLPPGRYNVTAQHSGFTTVEIRNVVLNTSDQLALRIKLEVGPIGETVTIIDNPSSVQDSATIGTVINRQFVENLPLNGRSFQSLFALTPGVVLTNATFNNQGQFSVNGQRANANYFMVDGVSANIGVSAGAAPGQSAGGSLPALTTLGSTNNLVSIDALEEFRILSSSYGPEFGRTPGAQILIITRSGGNTFNGGVFNYFRNDALDASDWFANTKGLRRPAIRQNDFGGVLGGPIVRDRAFFFASYEGLRLRQPQLGLTEVPSTNSRQLAPVALQPFLNGFPIPNGPETHDGFAEFAASYSDPSSLNATSLRIDSSNERLALFGRVNHAGSRTTQRGSTIVPGFSANTVVNPTLSLSLNNLSRANSATTTVTLGATYSFSTGRLNEFRANWSRARGATSFALDDFGGATPLPAALLFPPSASLQDAGFQFLLGGGTNTSLAVGKNVNNLQRQINLVDNFTLIRQSHQFRFGVDYRRLTPVYDSLSYNQSVIYEGITGASGPASGTALSGLAKSVFVFGGAGPRFPVFTNFSAYAQDTYRMTSRLSLTYGLRWEFNPAPKEARGNNPFTVAGLDNPTTLKLAPRGSPLWKSTYGNLAPRAGIVQQLSTTPGRELILRAGFGVFFDLGNGQAAQGFGNVFPFISLKSFSDVPFPLTPEQALAPPFSFTPPFSTIVAFNPNLKLPRTTQWSIVLDQSLDANQNVVVAYLGALGNSLLREDVLLDPNPDFKIVRLTQNGASSNYHGMQLQYERRWARGLQALVSYSWSRSADNASSDSLPRLRVGSVGGVAGDDGPTRLTSVIDFAPSDFDVRHSVAAAITYGPLKPRVTFPGSSFFRDWSIDAIVRARTATPVNVVVRADVIGENLILELQRPDLIPGVPVYLRDPMVAGGRRINRDAFSIPTQIRQGTLGYNALRGFGFHQVDLGLRRQFDLSERLKLQFKGEVFNLLNHPNFGNPINTLSSSLFGQSTQMLGRSLGNGGINGGLSPIYQIGGARSVQLAVRLQF